MAKKPKVWFVDDLPQNLQKFQSNHQRHFKIRTFSRTEDVLDRIRLGKRPDALLCDVFFYDSVIEAQRVETEVEKLAAKLKAAATKAKANDPERAKGITLMRSIYKYYGNHPPPFPMYAYTSKGPFLLEQRDWENISKYGAEVLLKNFIVDNLHLEFEEFNRVPSAGVSNQMRLQEMLDKCGFGLFVLTGEDIHKDSTKHARENVIHEVGLFQGRLGWRRAIVLLEKGCKEFSNIVGSGQIRFKKGKIKSCYPEIRRVLEREGLVETAS